MYSELTTTAKTEYDPLKLRQAKMLVKMGQLAAKEYEHNALVKLYKRLLKHSTRLCWGMKIKNLRIVTRETDIIFKMTAELDKMIGIEIEAISV